MLKGGCIHPGITAAAALCGHGDQILIADGNYPLGSRIGEAEKIFLGLRQNLSTVQEGAADASHAGGGGERPGDGHR